MRNRNVAMTVLALLAGALTACGSPRAPGVQLAPSAGSTQASIPTTPKPPPALATKPTVTPPSGPPPTTLVTKDLVTGTGKTASAGQTITVNYVGVLYKTGKEFDSSWQRNQPFTTPLSTAS